jgi:hypothetical protein
MLLLLILESSSEELITGEITSLGMIQMCSSGCERASLCDLGRLLYIIERGPTIYTFVHHDYGVLTHMVGPPSWRVHLSPYVGFKNRHHVVSCPIKCARGGAPG